MYDYTETRKNHIKKFNNDNIATRWLNCVNLYYSKHKYDINSDFLYNLNNKNYEKTLEIFTLITEYDNNDNGTYWFPTLRQKYDETNIYKEYDFTFIKLYAEDVIFL
jgi:hypothetical protein